MHSAVTAVATVYFGNVQGKFYVMLYCLFQPQ